MNTDNLLVCLFFVVAISLGVAIADWFDDLPHSVGNPVYPPNWHYESDWLQSSPKWESHEDAQQRLNQRIGR